MSDKTKVCGECERFYLGKGNKVAATFAHFQILRTFRQWKCGVDDCGTDADHHCFYPDKFKPKEVDGK